MAAKKTSSRGSVKPPRSRSAAKTSRAARRRGAARKKLSVPERKRGREGDELPAMAIGAARTRMASSARTFDVSKVKAGELALVAAVSSGDE